MHGWQQIPSISKNKKRGWISLFQEKPVIIYNINDTLFLKFEKSAHFIEKHIINPHTRAHFYIL